ncbi:MAG TPA: hypothetical protein V6D19_11400 [Stenomitos sp.]
MEPPVLSDLQIKLGLARFIEKETGTPVVVDAFAKDAEGITVEYEDMDGNASTGQLSYDGTWNSEI